MAKSRGAKRGKKRKNKRIAAHIKDAAQRRLAEKNSDHNSGSTTPLVQERPHKRPRESGEPSWTSLGSEVCVDSRDPLCLVEAVGMRSAIVFVL